MSEIKRALTEYYAKLELYCRETYDDAPTVPYTDELDDALLSSPADDDGECAWRPVSVRQGVNWHVAEAKLGFPVHAELCGFFDELLFCSLCGAINGFQLYLTPHTSEKGLTELMMRQHREAAGVFENDGYFYLGFAIRDGDDDYGVYYDNAAGTPLCVEHETGEAVTLSPSLAELISEMEVFD